jgi:hypothetical protein
MPAVLPPGVAGWIGSGFECKGDCGYGSDCCPKPVVLLSNASGGGAYYFVSNAVSAEITIACGSSAPTTTPLTLVDGIASAVYATATDVCFISVTATNECGTTTRYWRNYTTPRNCDCINAAFDPPSKWGRSGRIITTISGSLIAQPLNFTDSSGTAFCASPAACGDVSGSFVRDCRDVANPNRRYIVTSSTGCGLYRYFVEMRDISAWSNYPGVFPGYTSQFFISSGFFRANSNPYPTLTEVDFTTSLTTLLGVITGSGPSAATIQQRNASSAQIYQLNFAPGAAMLRCYLGPLTPVFDFWNTPSATASGHCDLSGLTITAEVV